MPSQCDTCLKIVEYTIEDNYESWYHCQGCYDDMMEKRSEEEYEQYVRETYGVSREEEIKDWNADYYNGIR